MKRLYADHRAHAVAVLRDCIEEGIQVELDFGRLRVRGWIVEVWEDPISVKVRPQAPGVTLDAGEEEKRYDELPGSIRLVDGHSELSEEGEVVRT